MSEIEALLGLYGAIDRAVVAGEVDGTSLAPLLGAYRDDAAKGWYDDHYLPWVHAVRERRVLGVAIPPVHLDVDQVRQTANTPPVQTPAGGPRSLPLDAPQHRAATTLDDLHRLVSLPLEDLRRLLRPVVPAGPVVPVTPVTPDVPGPATVDMSPHAQEIRAALVAFGTEPVEGRVAARRLLALAVAAIAMPQHFGSGGSAADVARVALNFKRPDVDPSGVAAGELAARLQLQVAEQFTSMSQWQKFVANGVSTGVLPMSFEVQAAAPPCTGKLIMRPGPDQTDLDPCTVLETEFITNQVTFEQAKNFLEPSNWQYPGSFWCQMQQGAALGTNSWLYHETVATSCPPNTSIWSVSTDLQFWFSHPTATEARAEYDLAPGLPLPTSDINVDEGSLRISQLADGSVHVQTTKRVRFAGSFDGACLAMFMCATGYSTIVEDIVLTIATAPPNKSVPFPVQAPNPSKTSQGAIVTTGPNPPKNNTTTTNTPSGTGTGSAADTIGAITDDTAAAVAAYLKDVTTVSSSSLALIQAGNYKVEDAWSDGIKLWSTYMNGLTTAIALGARTAKVYAVKPPTGL
jgi:hypothetical protein